MTTPLVDLDRDVCYRALRTRDARFDGRFFTAVVSTGIYCRPICPARLPRIENCLFLPSAGAAHQMGFRPCLRCRPEVAPGLAGWRGSANTVSRALGLIAEGGFDEGGADELANRLGVGARHLRRLFDRYVGASPVSVAQAHRILFAKKLITETALSMTEIALASGFGSVRRFNDVFHQTYRRTPSDLRRKKRPEAEVGAGIELELPFAAPYDWRAMIDFLAARAIPGVEAVEAGAYRRTFACCGATGTLEVRPVVGQNVLLAIIHTSDVKPLGILVARLRRLFDLDADIAAIDEHLARDPELAPRVEARPGLRGRRDRRRSAADPLPRHARRDGGAALRASGHRSVDGAVHRDARAARAGCVSRRRSRSPPRDGDQRRSSHARGAGRARRSVASMARVRRASVVDAELSSAEPRPPSNRSLT